MEKFNTNGKTKMNFSKRFRRNSSWLAIQLLFSILLLNLARQSAPILNREGGFQRRETGRGTPDTFFGGDPNTPNFPAEERETPSNNPGGSVSFEGGGEQQFQFGGGANNSPFRGPPSSSSTTTSVCNSRGEVCQIYSKCAIYQPELFVNKNNVGAITKCTLDDDSEGICCKTIGKNRAETPPLPMLNQGEADIQTRFLTGIGASKNAQNPSQQPIDFSTLENTLAKTQIYFNSYDSTEKRLLDRNLAIKRGTSSFGHLLFFQTSKAAILQGRLGLNLVQATKELKADIPLQTRIFGGNGNEVEADVQYGIGVKIVNIQGSSQGTQCPGPIVCDPRYNVYRTVDGTCNNLANGRYGAALTPLLRLVQPAYYDGIWNPRQSRSGLPLPSARLLSSSFNQDVDNPNPFYSLWVMQFGQFLDHDLSHVPVYRYSNGSGIECCTEDGDFLPQMQTHPLCLPIEIPNNDGFYRPFRQKCMNFVRSMVGPREDCSLGYADQLNQITSYLDNSNIYGSSIVDHDKLREFRGGRLKTGEIQASFGSRTRGSSGSRSGSGKDFFGQSENLRSPNTFLKGMLPLQSVENTLDECTDPEKGTQCFLAGDLRVNEMLGLTVTHLIWLREHNRVAGILEDLNPHWNDNQLFSEARRIVNAQYQHIVYNEWLPIVIGRQYMEVYGILPQATGYYQGYNPNINPGVSNAFAAAAFRMGHTLIQGLLPLINEAGMVEDNLVIHEHFNRPFRIRERRMVDKLVRTLSTKNIQGFDQFITSEVTNRLFQEDDKPYGMDLISLNIQRARDHGLPGYNTYRQLCQLKRAKKFTDFHDWISKDLTDKLSRYYESVDDVDLFIGGILENPLPGALLGPTFTCIIGDQFARARKGDRFEYDVGPFSSSFSLGQLYEIRKASFARILCDNSDNLATMQPFAFILPNQRNPMLSCDSRSIPKLDLSQWRASK